MNVNKIIRALRENKLVSRRLLNDAANMIEELYKEKEKRTDENFNFYKGTWISTAERVPLRTGEYIVVIEGFSVATALYYDAAMRLWIDRLDEDPTYYRVSFWMEMPEVPEKAKKQRVKRGKCYGQDSKK